MEGIENKDNSTDNAVIEDKSKIRKRNGWDEEKGNNNV